MSEAISCGGVVIFRGKILVLYKNYKNKYEGWVLPKGTVEKGEEFKQTALREVKEETGLTLTAYRFRGLITFISDECEPELMCLFTANDYDGEVIICDEGDLCWVSKDKILELPTWEGDAVFLKLLLSDEQRFFTIKLRYEGDKLIEKNVQFY